MPDKATVHPDGILWFTGYDSWTEGKAECLLERYDVERIVVGHAPHLMGDPRVRFGGRLYLADTGMMSTYYRGGHLAMLGIWDHVVRPLCLDGAARYVQPRQTPIDRMAWVTASRVDPSSSWAGPDAVAIARP